jgi:hypothetical protein
MVRDLAGPAIVVASTLIASSVSAGSAAVEASSLSLFRQESRHGIVHPTYPTWATFSVATRRVKMPWPGTTSLVLSTWGRFDPASPRDGRTVAGDIGLAYAEGTLGRDRVLVRAGRQLLFEGAGRGLHVDGAWLRTDLLGGFGATLYAGVPIRLRFFDFRGLVAAGGRVFWRHSSDTEIGLSFVHVMAGGRPSQQDIAMDGRYWLHNSFSLVGLARWSSLAVLTPVAQAIPRPSDVRAGGSVVTNAKTASGVLADGGSAWQRATQPLKEAELALIWQPLDSAQFVLRYRRTDPTLFLSQASVFSVFSDERRDQAGVFMALDPLRSVSINADADVLNLPSGVGLNAGVRSVLRPRLLRNPTTLGAETRVFLVPINGYWQLRAFGSHKLYGLASVSADADLHILVREVHGKRYEASVATTCFITPIPQWNVGVALVVGTSPLVRYRVEALARASWGFSTLLPRGW